MAGRHVANHLVRDIRFFGVAFDLWGETGPARRSGGPREVGFSISS